MRKMTHSVVMFKVCIAFFIAGGLTVDAVQITKLYVPRGASHEAPLDCRYILDSQQLYHVNWYKDGANFFRCLPSGDIVEFAVEGVKVIHSGYATQGSCSLTLMMLNKKSAGEYKCEVTTEGPAFETAVAAGKLRIIESARRTQNQTKNENNQMTSQSSHSANFRMHSVYFGLLYVLIVIKYIIY